MADWIKMRCNLSSHPKVVRVAKRLSVTVCNAIGALHAVWTVADQHATEDGLLEMDVDSLDEFTEIPGFCRELEAVGWLEIGDEFVKFPEYYEHNGTTAKSRALTAKRVSKHRKAVTVERYTSVTRGEEKRREKNIDSTPRTKRFKPPTVEEVASYCKERNNSIDAEHFVAYYETRDWKVKGGDKMKNWKTAVITWEKNPFNRSDDGDSHSGPHKPAEGYLDE